MASQATDFLFFVKLPDLNDLVSIGLDVDYPLDNRRIYCKRILKCREFIFTFPLAIATPEVSKSNQILAVVQRELFKNLEFREKISEMNMSLSDVWQTSHADVQDCLRYTVIAKMAPSWNLVNNFLVQGRDFLTATGPHKAISMELVVSDEELHLSLRPLCVHLPQTKVEHYETTIHYRNWLMSGNSKNSLYIPLDEDSYALPSMKSCRLMSITNYIPEDSIFKDYNEIKKYWKNMYGYRLPEENETDLWYGSVVFRLNSKTEYTYPLLCVRPCEISPIPRMNPEGALSTFLTEFQHRVKSICGSSAKLTEMKASFPVPRLYPATDVMPDMRPRCGTTYSMPQSSLPSKPFSNRSLTHCCSVSQTTTPQCQQFAALMPQHLASETVRRPRPYAFPGESYRGRISPPNSDCLGSSSLPHPLMQVNCQPENQIRMRPVTCSQPRYSSAQGPWCNPAFGARAPYPQQSQKLVRLGKLSPRKSSRFPRNQNEFVRHSPADVYARMLLGVTSISPPKQSEKTNERNEVGILASSSQRSKYDVTVPSNGCSSTGMNENLKGHCTENGGTRSELHKLESSDPNKVCTSAKDPPTSSAEVTTLRIMSAKETVDLPELKEDTVTEDSPVEKIKISGECTTNSEITENNCGNSGEDSLKGGQGVFSDAQLNRTELSVQSVEPKVSPSIVAAFLQPIKESETQAVTKKNGPKTPKLNSKDRTSVLVSSPKVQAGFATPVVKKARTPKCTAKGGVAGSHSPSVARSRVGATPTTKRGQGKCKRSASKSPSSVQEPRSKHSLPAMKVTQHPATPSSKPNSASAQTVQASTSPAPARKNQQDFDVQIPNSTPSPPVKGKTLSNTNLAKDSKDVVEATEAPSIATGFTGFRFSPKLGSSLAVQEPSHTDDDDDDDLDQGQIKRTVDISSVRFSFEMTYAKVTKEVEESSPREDSNALPGNTNKMDFVFSPKFGKIVPDFSSACYKTPTLHSSVTQRTGQVQETGSNVPLRSKRVNKSANPVELQTPKYVPNFFVKKPKLSCENQTGISAPKIVPQFVMKKSSTSALSTPGSKILRPIQTGTVDPAAVSSFESGFVSTTEKDLPHGPVTPQGNLQRPPLKPFLNLCLSSTKSAATKVGLKTKRRTGHKAENGL